VYLCISESWRELGEFGTVSDSLPNCTEKREGERVFLSEEHVTLVCSANEWKCYDIFSAVEEEENSKPESSSSENEWEDYEPVSSSSTKVSSSSTKVSSSSTKVSSGTKVPDVPGSPDLWNGAAGDYRVITGFDDGSDKSGYWYSYDDQPDGGSSAITWPISPGIMDSDEAFNPIIDHCGGLCGNVSIGAGVEYPFAGVAFNLTGPDQKGVDISSWGGLCVTYTSDIEIRFILGPEDEANYTAYNNHKYYLETAFSVKTINIPWPEFKQESGWGNSVTLTQLLTRVARIKFEFGNQVAGASGDFNIIAIGRLGSCTASSESVESGTFTDSRNGQIYKTVKIEEQVWMAENLNYETENSYCYNDSTENCKKYGRLYTWEATLNACPEGWHLPTNEEFETLISNVGGEEYAAELLKSTTGWQTGNGIDKYGFNVLPAGLRNLSGNFERAGEYAYFWNATECPNYEDHAYNLRLYYLSDDAPLYSNYKDAAISVRCLRD
jgi:uncharacterized protein (TIGR02145 family)